MTLLIDPEKVRKAFLSSLYKDEELEGKEGTPETAVIVEGIVGKFGFHPTRLEEQRDQVAIWLRTLPSNFHKDQGGGWSFLNACIQEDGSQWTGLHQRMEQLFCMGIGLGLVKSLFPREMWEVLPGSMPYYVVELPCVAVTTE